MCCTSIGYNTDSEYLNASNIYSATNDFSHARYPLESMKNTIPSGLLALDHLCVNLSIQNQQEWHSMKYILFPFVYIEFKWKRRDLNIDNLCVLCVCGYIRFRQSRLSSTQSNETHALTCTHTTRDHTCVTHTQFSYAIQKYSILNHIMFHFE